MDNEKPVVVYLHRYPPEIEALQWPALKELAAALIPNHRLVYMCMKPAGCVRDPALRSMMDVEEFGFSVDQSSHSDKLVKTFTWYMYLGRILKRIRQLNPAVIICKETLPLIPGRVVDLGFPTVITTSDWWWSILFGDTKVGRKFANWMERFEVAEWHRSNVIATVGTVAEGRLLHGKGLPYSHIEILPTPQNKAAFHPISPRPDKRELGLDPNMKHFAICGIIRKGKGYDQLLDWWKLAVSKHPDWRLIIIGGAGGEAWCRNEIKKRGLDSAVIMTGWLSAKSTVNYWLNAADGILAHRRNSSDNQGIVPSALFNGMSTGRPVIASGLPGMAELLRDGIDGFLYRPDDGNSFVSTLERVVSDPVRADELGLAGASRASDCFNPAKTVSCLVDMIDDFSEWDLCQKTRFSMKPSGINKMNEAHCKYRQISKSGIGHRSVWCDLTGYGCLNLDADQKNCPARLVRSKVRRRIFAELLFVLLSFMLFLMFLTWLGRSWM